jgi:hypothetical protein
MDHFRYLGTTITNQNVIQKKIKRRLNSESVCYLLAQNLLSSCLLFKDVKIRIYKIMFLSVILYGCETCSLILREEHRRKLFENRVLRRIFGENKEK